MDELLKNELDSVIIGTTKFDYYSYIDDEHDFLSCSGDNLNIDDIKKVINYLKEKGKNNFKVRIFLSYFKDKFNLDLSALKEYKDILIIRYGNEWDLECSYDEFINYQNIIREKIAEINKASSPLEKLTIAYDLVKKKEYKLSEDETLNGCPHACLTGDYIDCRGYCEIVKELLFNQEGINIINQGYNVYDKNGAFIDGHDRIVVMINDPKYNVNGLYVLDPTFDAYNPLNKDEEILGEDYKPEDLYAHFMMPINDYLLYSDEIYDYRMQFIGTFSEIDLDNPDINMGTLEHLKRLLVENKMDDLFDKGFFKVFGDCSFDKILEIIEQSTEKLPSEILEKLLYEVRKLEGYSDPYEETERALRITNKVENYIYKQELTK